VSVAIPHPVDPPAPGGLRSRVYDILERAPADPFGRAVGSALVLLITINVAAMVLGTVAGFGDTAYRVFDSIERVSLVIFTLEYAVRLWSATASPRFQGAIRGRARYARTPMAIIDLLAIAPFWLPVLGVDLRGLRVIRLFRLFRLAKLVRYSAALQTFARVFAAKKEELVVTFSVGGAVLLVGSSLIYFAENAAQPEVFGSIPHAMWWGIATLSTVGYGDVFPITVAGRVLAALVAVVGIGMFALPAGVLGAAFLDEMQSRKPRGCCPHCGKDLP
jgi:voltage-gated potassium channel